MTKEEIRDLAFVLEMLEVVEMAEQDSYVGVAHNISNRELKNKDLGKLVTDLLDIETKFSNLLKPYQELREGLKLV